MYALPERKKEREVRRKARHITMHKVTVYSKLAVLQ